MNISMIKLALRGFHLSGFATPSTAKKLRSVGRFLDRNLWPDFRVFRIQRQPFLKPWVGIGFYGIHGTFRYANTAVDAFVRVDHEHVLALVEAIHGAHLNAVHGFAANAALIDDVGQS